jgi:beta-RFAP synthase
VRTTSRLHLGFLNPGSPHGRQFGSIGLALDAPATEITLRRAEAISASGPDAARAAPYLARVLAGLDIAPGHALRLRQAVPAHAGLGSGTQLALAVAAAVRCLHGCAQDVRADAALLERGARSGIGVALFEQGGLVVDGGSAPDATMPPPLLARLAFPPAWRVILLLDPAARGLSGPPERAAFAALPPFSDAASAALCRLLLLQILPAVVEADLAAFGDGIAQVQAALGSHFSKLQGGRFSSPRVAAACAALARDGAVGIGQSSWGPTGFAFAHAETAAAMVARLTRSGAADGLDVRVCAARDTGATIALSNTGAREQEVADDGG